ncbi:unnamed protein product [Rhizophagus irregularis]|nr:unnamed protein product [Rhizophagus irregularis]
MLASSNLPIVGHRYFLFIITFLILYLSISYIISCFPHIDNKITNKKQISYNDKILSSNSHSCLGPESNEERYMTYLPHSGFHNQRNMLENAVFLSWYDNW